MSELIVTVLSALTIFISLSALSEEDDRSKRSVIMALSSIALIGLILL